VPTRLRLNLTDIQDHNGLLKVMRLHLKLSGSGVRVSRHQPRYHLQDHRWPSEASISSQLGSTFRLAIVMLIVSADGVAGDGPQTGPLLTAAGSAVDPQLVGDVVHAPRANHNATAPARIFADEHGGTRAAGTPGYDASVAYVVGVLRDLRYGRTTGVRCDRRRRDRGDGVLASRAGSARMQSRRPAR
jgi:hypothetical protein